MTVGVAIVMTCQASSKEVQVWGVRLAQLSERATTMSATMITTMHCILVQVLVGMLVKCTLLGQMQG